MLKLLVTAYGQTKDYSRYVDWHSVSVSEQSINVPVTMTLVMMPSDGLFIVPPRMAYVQLRSDKTETSVYSGFVTAEPLRTYLALSQSVPTYAGGQLFAYAITCSSDEYLLNNKAIPFIPAFVNRYQGEILSDLAGILCPAFFDTSLCQKGDLVPYFDYKPTQGWSEIAKQFGDASRFRYRARDKRIWYVPFGDQDLGIAYDETMGQGSFDPVALKTTPLPVPYVNDLTVIGDVEAGNIREDYFIGDGFTANFPLRHQVFRGASTLLLQEPWTNPGLNTQSWFIDDPGANFDFTAGTLNVLDQHDPFVSGFSYLMMNNGVELAGGIDIQVGEVIVTDYCDGILGGLYTDTDFEDDTFVAGFVLSSPDGVVLSASGAVGVHIQPMWGTTPVGPAVISKSNHSYVLQMIFHSAQYIRYEQKYRTLGGEEFGGRSRLANGNVSFVIQDFDITAATGVFYNPEVTQTSVNDVEFPAFAVMALVNNHKLNLSLSNTTVSQMPAGGLEALVGPSGLVYPTGLILPMLPPDLGGYTGPASDISGAASGNILLDPGALDTLETPLVLGAGFDLQAAQVTQGQTADTLAFYVQSLAAAGTRIRFQSWEAQAAVSRLQVTGAIIEQRALVGDDGLRSAIVSNMNPLPRTSEDCDHAAQAYLRDRAGTQYNGSYSAQNVPPASFFHGDQGDAQYWPCVGRFLHVNAPRRGIEKQKYLVASVTTKVLEPKNEYLEWNISFGADLFLEKTLKNFVDLQPVNVLTPKDKANPPNPILTQDINNAYLIDLAETHLDMPSIRDHVEVHVTDPWQGQIEVRRQDTNWGRSQVPVVTAAQLENAAAADGHPIPQTDFNVFSWAWFYQRITGRPGLFFVDPPLTFLLIADYMAGLVANGLNTGVSLDDRTLIGVYRGPVFKLPRTQFDEVWYMRAVTASNSAFGVITSRRSKAIHVYMPLKPAPPLFVSQTSTLLQFNFAGDQRNIYGFELRMVITAITPGFPQLIGDTIVLVQKPVASYADMAIDLVETDYVSLAQSVDTATIQVYFFNAGWIYSEPLNVPVEASDLLAVCVGVSQVGKPTDGQQIALAAMPYNGVFPVDFAGSTGSSKVAPTADAEYTIFLRGVQIGTITAGPGGVYIAHTTSRIPIPFAINDRFELYAPATADLTLESVAFVFRAIRLGSRV